MLVSRGVRRGKGAVLLCGAALLAIGCQPEQKPAQGADVSAPPPAVANEVTFHARDFAFSGPDTIPAGVTTMTLVNDGPGLHHIQLVKIDSGRTADEVRAALKDSSAFPSWTSLAGGPNVTRAGDSSAVTLDLTPGWYVMLSLVDYPSRVPDYERGMVRALYVAPSTAPMPTLRPADITINGADHSFALSDSVRSGPRTIDFKNTGTQPHELFLLKVKPGMTLHDAKAWFGSYKVPAPLTVEGGVSAIEPDAMARFAVNVTPGQYVLLCLVADAKDGKTEASHGMVVPFTVR